MSATLETTPGALELLAWVASLLALEVAHSARTRGRFVTVRFFGFALAFFFLKGLVDLPRLPEETPFVMNVALFKRGRFNLGVHLLLWPLARCSLAYLGFTAAHAFLRWKRHGDVRFFRLNGFSIISYGLLGSVVEAINVHTGWWTWKMDIAGNAPGGGFLGYFVLWLAWGVGCFPSVLLNFLELERPRRVQNAGLVYLVAYWVLVLVISAVAANLRNPVLFVLGSCEVCGSFFPRGPRVVPLRRAPDASRDVAPQEHVL